MAVVKRTGHSSYYVEKGMAAMGKTASQMGIQGDYRICGGGKIVLILSPQLAEFQALSDGMLQLSLSGWR